MEQALTATPQDVLENNIALYSKGRRTFSLLFTRWMDTNGWSHPVMTKLVQAALGDTRWLHSSQISSLRHNGSENPGPRTFVAIAQLNYYIHRYATTKKPIPGTKTEQYQAAFAITEDGEPPTAGWWLEVFCGLRIPKDIDLREAYFSEKQAEQVSISWGAMIRKLMRDKDLDLISDLDPLLREAYPAKDVVRVKSVRQVVHGNYVWTPEELCLELPAITAFTAELGGPSNETDLLTILRD